VRTADADVVRLLKVFTFLSAPEIAELEREVQADPEQRTAQKTLAQEVTRTVHGQHGLDVALRASGVLFGAAMDGLHAEELLDVFANVPSAELPRTQVQGAPVVDVVVTAGLCRSKGEARRLIENGGLYVNNVRVAAPDAVLRPEQIVDGRVVVLRSGKRSFHLVRTA
jgi:tyrosyl-tRNA synthetase